MNTDLYIVNALVKALEAYASGKRQVQRNWTPTIMLNLATTYTGQPYRRGEYDFAIEDLQGWIEARERMAAARGE